MILRRRPDSCSMGVDRQREYGPFGDVTRLGVRLCTGAAPTDSRPKALPLRWARAESCGKDSGGRPSGAVRRNGVHGFVPSGFVSPGLGFRFALHGPTDLQVRAPRDRGTELPAGRSRSREWRSHDLNLGKGRFHCSIPSEFPYLADVHSRAGGGLFLPFRSSEIEIEAVA